MADTKNIHTLTNDDLGVLFRTCERLGASGDAAAKAAALAGALCTALEASYHPEEGLLFNEKYIVDAVKAIEQYAFSASEQLEEVIEEYTPWYKALRLSLPNDVC